MTEESGFHATATFVPTSFRELGDLLIVTIKTLGYLNEEKKQNIKVHSYYWLQKKKLSTKKKWIWNLRRAKFISWKFFVCFPNCTDIFFHWQKLKGLKNHNKTKHMPKQYAVYSPIEVEWIKLNETEYVYMMIWMIFLRGYSTHKHCVKRWQPTVIYPDYTSMQTARHIPHL